jgi:hypothetical protein
MGGEALGAARENHRRRHTMINDRHQHGGGTKLGPIPISKTRIEDMIPLLFAAADCPEPDRSLRKEIGRCEFR